MEFLDNFCKKASEAVNAAAKGAGRLSDSAKLKYYLMREKAKLEDAYKELGEIYYKQLKSADFNESKIAVAYDKIEKSVSEIDRLNKEIDAFNNTKVIKPVECKYHSEADVCPKCGKRHKTSKN